LFQGAHLFKAKVNIEVQWASEPVIAAIERNGGVITTAYYDTHCLHAMCDTEQFFSRGRVLKKCLSFLKNNSVHQVALQNFLMIAFL